MTQQHRSRRTSHAGNGISGLCLQLLTTEWTKESRGGSGARLRNTTPLALALPESWRGAEDGPPRVHHVYFSEQRRFLPREWTKVHKEKAFLEAEAFRIECSEEGVRVLLDYGRMGMPGRLEWSGVSRGEPYEELFRLAPGQWARGVYNERIQYWDTGQWGYCKHVLNVGLLRDVSPDLFLSTRPAQRAVREFLLRRSGPASEASTRLHSAAP
jgi:hypothetical protein